MKAVIIDNKPMVALTVSEILLAITAIYDRSALLEGFGWNNAELVTHCKTFDSDFQLAMIDVWEKMKEIERSVIDG